LEVVGVAFQGLSKQEAEGCGFIIPAEVLRHFLEDCERRGGFTGFAALGIEAQSLENDALRELYRMT
jgi:S1-C subfamily serine protease